MPEESEGQRAKPLGCSFGIDSAFLMRKRFPKGGKMRKTDLKSKINLAKEGTRIFVLFVGTSFMVGCASQKSATPVASVKTAEEKFEKTEDYVKRAEEEIIGFEKKVQNLLKEANSSKELRAKEKFSEALQSVEKQLAAAQRQFAQLKLSNKNSWEEFKERIDHAGSAMKKEMIEDVE